MSNNLQLSLISKWYQMTGNGKPEDYREITPYWCNRFLLFRDESMPVKWWKEEFFDYGTFSDTVENIGIFCCFKKFTHNVMTLGYPKAGDPDRTKIFEHAGIEIRTGNLEWGAEPCKLYFVIKHGKQL